MATPLTCSSVLSAVPASTPATSIAVSPTDPVIQSMTRLLQAQTEIMTTQAKAAALQTLPTLSSFTGEGADVSDDSFDKWLEKFQESAKFAGRDVNDQYTTTAGKDSAGYLQDAS